MIKAEIGKIIKMDKMEEMKLIPELKEKFLRKIENRLIYCYRCEAVWIRKSNKRKPKRCPYCNSPYYDRPRQRDVKIALTNEIKF